MPALRQFEDVAVRVITVRCTEAQRRELERVAKINQTTVSGAIREAVDEYTADCQDALIFKRKRSGS